MRWSGVALALLLAVAPALAQVQPGPPDVTGLASREEVAAAGDLTGAQRVLRFVQVSDAHVLDDDAPYPLRQEPVDNAGPPVEAAQRPQEEYTDEVLESIVRAINVLHAEDAFQFVINTGDNVDNDLENELMRFLDLWDGTATTTGPVSGLACVPDGQSTDLADTSHDVADRCTSLPEALAGNRTALAPGLPWYSAFGNHDALIQGNVNRNDQFDAVAADQGRHFLTQPDYVRMHFPALDACAGGSAADDFGHGYGNAGERLCDDDPDNDGYYAFDLSGVRFLVLDTVNDDFASSGGLQGVFNPQTMIGADVIGGYAEGSVDPAQGAWLDAEIAAHPDQLLVVFSHHTINSMFTNLAAGYCQGGQCLGDLLVAAGYRTGEGLEAQLAAQPNMAGWIGGHTHRHRIQPKGDGAFWNIESSSLIDYPQEARVVELWVTADGSKGFWLLRSFTHDFELSRSLELTDAQRVPAAAGADVDQDTLLWFDIPAGVRLKPMPPALRLEVRFAPDGNVSADTPFDLAFTATSLAGPLPPVEGQPGGTAFDLEVRAFLDGSPEAFGTIPLQAVDNGTVTGNLAVPALEAGTHSIRLHFLVRQWERDVWVPASEQEETHWFAAQPAALAKNGKDSPPLPAVALLGLAAALLLARRR